ncbi:MAG: hypothetical protein AAF830_12720 [Pseudomonadota bacterium]
MKWHFWVVGVLALIWHGFGVLNAVMHLTAAETLYAAEPEQLAYIQNMPLLSKVTLIAAVTSGILGALTFFMRKRVTTTLWIVSLVMVLLSTVQDVLLGGLELFGAGMVLSTTVTLVIVQVALLYYVRAQVKSGNFS